MSKRKAPQNENPNQELVDVLSGMYWQIFLSFINLFFVLVDFRVSPLLSLFFIVCSLSFTLYVFNLFREKINLALKCNKTLNMSWVKDVYVDIDILFFCFVNFNQFCFEFFWYESESDFFYFELLIKEWMEKFPYGATTFSFDMKYYSI